MPREQVVRYLIDKLSIEEERAQMVARLSRGSLGWAIQAVNNPSVLDNRAGELERAMALMGSGLQQKFSAAADVASLYFRDRHQTMEVLNTWLGWWRDLLLVREGAQESVYNWDHLETLKERAQDYSPRQLVRFIGSILSTIGAMEHNANPRLTLEVMMLSMPGASTPVPRE
jgi:DNA polymerase-3 subunit delta'